MSAKVAVRLASAHRTLDEAVEAALERGMNRHDKYSNRPLTTASRELLRREVVNSFWVALEDMGVRIVGR